MFWRIKRKNKTETYNLWLKRVVHIYHYAEPVIIFFVNDPKPQIVFALLPTSTRAQTVAQQIATNLQDNIKKTFTTKFLLLLSKVTFLNTENSKLHYSGRSQSIRTLGREARFGNSWFKILTRIYVLTSESYSP